jgi:BirA family biotin operon repressor/biotin-[acetyl-CoA-carboxylase] ligase
VVWRDRIDSTNAEAARRAKEGAPEGLLVLADVQTAGRGRQGRRWQAPLGTSLMVSVLLRPNAPIDQTTLLPLLVGLVVVEACEALVPSAQLSLKWPNDLLANGRKCAGILVEVPTRGGVVAGAGINVDWRSVRRPAGLTSTTSLAEVSHGGVDRWRLLQILLEQLDRRYRAWRDNPRGFLPAYRERCVTIGQTVRVEQLDGQVLTGTATGVTDDGALLVDMAGAGVTVRAGDVHHLRHR